MEGYKCKLCTRTLASSRALGGHMKAHLAILRLPPPPSPPSEDEQSKRNRILTFGQNSEQKKLKESFLDSHSPLTETEPEQVSSISDTSPEEEVAITLMLLSRDKWKKKNNVVDKEKAEEVERSMGLMEEIKLKKVSGKQKCDKCRNNFGSSRALESHKIICLQNEANLVATSSTDHKIFQCKICLKVFGSGQALGGHKRSHFYPPLKKKLCFFDLNMPPLSEEDGPSVLSDA